MVFDQAAHLLARGVLRVGKRDLVVLYEFYAQVCASFEELHVAERLVEHGC